MTEIIELIIPIYKDQITEFDFEISSGELVRCKDCVHHGKVEKCVLAAIAAEENYPFFRLDNRGEWFCADGKRKETK